MVYITVGIPLQLSQVLLGYYSKMGYLTVWKICPILQGKFTGSFCIKLIWLI